MRLKHLGYLVSIHQGHQGQSCEKVESACCFYCILRSPRMLFWTNLVCRLPGGTLYRTHELAHPIIFYVLQSQLPSSKGVLQMFEHRSPPCLFWSARSSPGFRGSAQADFRLCTWRTNFHLLLSRVSPCNLL